MTDRKDCDLCEGEGIIYPLFVCRNCDDGVQDGGDCPDCDGYGEAHGIGIDGGKLGYPCTNCLPLQRCPWCVPLVDYPLEHDQMHWKGRVTP